MDYPDKMVFKLTSLGLVLALMTSYAKAESVNIASSTNNYDLQGHDVYYFEDQVGDMSIARILKNDEFKPLAKHNISFGFSSSAFWITFDVENKTQIASKMVVEMTYPIIDYMDFYVIDSRNQVEEVYNTGDRLPFAQRPIDFVNLAFPLTVEPNTTKRIFMRIQTKGTAKIPIKIWQEEDFYKNRQYFLMFQGLWLGSLLIMVFYNIFIYLSSRRVAYLYYVLFILSYLLWLCTMRGFVFQYLFPDNPTANNLILSVFTGFVSTFTGFFAIAFLDLRRVWPAAGRLLKFLSYVALISAFAGPFVPYAFIAVFQTIMAMLFLAILFPIGITRLMAGQKEARFFTIGWFSYILGGLAYGLTLAGWIPVNWWTENAQQIGSFLEILLLSLALGDRLNTLQIENHRIFEEKQAAQKKLLETQNEHIANLDREVEAKTRDIQIILKNVKSGFLLVNCHHLIQLGFTDSCHDLFGTAIKSETKITKYLGMSDRQQENFQLSLDQVFEDMLPPEITLRQVPKMFEINGKSLYMDGAAIRDDNDKVAFILFTIVDRSKQIQAEKIASTNQILVNVLQNKKAFRLLLVDFLKDYNLGMSRKMDSGEIKSFLHTLKGNLQNFGLREIAQFVHRLEEKDDINPQDWEQLKKMIFDYTENHSNLFGLNTNKLDEEKFEVVGTNLSYMEAELEQMKDLPGMREKLKGWFTEIRAQPLSQIVSPFGQMVDKLANQLGKKVHFSVKGSDLRLPDGLTTDVIKNLIHLLRNAVDHGIECPQDRGQKSKTGFIELSFAKKQDALVICIKDDGCGFDFQKIRTKAIQLGLITPEDQATDDSLCRIALTTDLSTCDEVTDISGRGVGMKAVFDAVDKAGGTFEIQSHQGEGSQITLRLNLSA